MPIWRPGFHQNLVKLSYRCDHPRLRHLCRIRVAPSSRRSIRRFSRDLPWSHCHHSLRPLWRPGFHQDLVKLHSRCNQMRLRRLCLLQLGSSSCRSSRTFLRGLQRSHCHHYMEILWRPGFHQNLVKLSYRFDRLRLRRLCLRQLGSSSCRSSRIFLRGLQRSHCHHYVELLWRPGFHQNLVKLSYRFDRLRLHHRCLRQLGSSSCRSSRTFLRGLLCRHCHH